MRVDIKTTTAVVTATGLLGAGLYAAVPALATTPERSPVAAAPGDGDRRPLERLRNRAGRGVRGEAVVRRDGRFVTVAWQNGEITAVSAGSVTVRSADGVTWQWTLDSGTRIRKNGDKAAASALAKGDRVKVVGTRAGTARTAEGVIVPRRS
ncbi:DUF5666 domain-containing protein [Thermomonospora cellulosilytica]|uniref:DUF5666 domain-containing protein n=1 Tax=Thermomonospora cellulosilytica TaxID=1411118 RepID=A0A7W3N228_9ACTN|nr:DUF5666 domain-containing protein [Thermomonospora cellulosilytica]MBA9006114.1 hypothetical protein [Thermomonospora cellulosilytica]